MIKFRDLQKEGQKLQEHEESHLLGIKNHLKIET